MTIKLNVPLFAHESLRMKSIKNFLPFILVLSLLVCGKANAQEIESLRRACEAGAAKDCAALAYRYFFGMGVKENREQALRYFEKGCELKHVQSCWDASSIYEEGRGMIKKDLKKAQTYKEFAERYTIKCLKQLPEPRVVEGKETQPMLKYDGKNLLISAPKAMLQALEAYAPNFRVWHPCKYRPSIVRGYTIAENEAISAVKGDFNGDGIMDLALHGSNPNAVLALVSGGEKFIVYKIDEGGSLDPSGFHWIYLSHVAPGIHASSCSECEEKPLALKTDAIGITFDGQAGVIRYFQGGELRQYITGD